MPDGEPDLDVLLDHASGMSSASRKLADSVFTLITDHEARRRGLELVELLVGLKMDIVTAMAA